MIVRELRYCVLWFAAIPQGRRTGENCSHPSAPVVNRNPFLCQQN